MVSIRECMHFLLVFIYLLHNSEHSSSRRVLKLPQFLSILFGVIIAIHTHEVSSHQN